MQRHYPSIVILLAGTPLSVSYRWIALCLIPCWIPPVSAQTEVAVVPLDRAALAGSWIGRLECPGGDIQFGWELAVNNGNWTATIVNGPDCTSVPKVHWDDDRLVMSFPHYDSSIEVRFDADQQAWQGTWTKVRGVDKTASLSFRAVRAKSQVPTSVPQRDQEVYLGRWRMQFESSTDPAVGIVHAEADGQLWATVLTTTGDFGYLGGHGSDGGLSFSTFDGGHAFLLSVERLDEHQLRGEFWSGDWWHESWTAERDDSVQLPDAFAITETSRDASVKELTFKNLDGNDISLGGPDFRGKILILDLFGSWCPNCHDAAAVLDRFHEKYANDGLLVVGLAFELTGDFERDAHQVKTYLERHQVTHPVLIAGVSDREKASAAMPVLDGIRAFPTFVFVNRDGQVAAVYTGFVGPAAAAEHEREVARMEKMIQRLLHDAAP